MISRNKKNLLSKFLGIERWKLLFRTYHHNKGTEVDEKINSFLVFLALLLSITPIITTRYLPSNVSTIIFGTTCLFAILFRNHFKFPNISFYKSIKLDIAITHTAFALGCIPSALILILSPEIISQHSETIAANLKVASPTGNKPTVAIIFSYIVFISLWVAILEEVIYRGLLLSSIRRWNKLQNNKYRDIISILFSSLVFGFAHYHSWGLNASIALVGLGIGFGVAYICTKEKLLPLIIYHFLFDLISFSIVAF